MSLQLSVNGSEYPRGEKLEPARNQEVLAQETRQIVAQITKAVLSVRTLVNAMETPVRIAPVSEGKLTSVADKVNLPVDYLGIEVLLNNIAARLDTRKFEFCPSLAPNLTAFDHVVSTQLAISPDYWSTWQLPIETLSDVNKIVDEVIKHSFKSYFKKVEVVSFDGVPLRAYAGGKKDAKAVVVVPVCGMPVELSERWLRSLADDYYVITWESRGLFGEIADFDTLAYDVESQAKDLLAVMDHFGVGFAHVMGLCGGAVIALIASSVAPERVSTLSLWHGDYELGSNCPKTRHQQDLLMLMSMASESRKQAASLQKLFIKPSVLNNMRADVAHLILYPYATGELLFRYAKLNGRQIGQSIAANFGSNQ
jgi:3-oxoadipate enol-lactonase